MDAMRRSRAVLLLSALAFVLSGCPTSIAGLLSKVGEGDPVLLVLEGTSGGMSGTAGIIASGIEIVFEDTTLGDMRLRPFHVCNDGAAELTLAEPAWSGTGLQAFSLVREDGTSITWPVSLAPSEYLDLAVRFRPGSAEALSAELSLGTNDPAEPAFLIKARGYGTTSPTGGPSLAGLEVSIGKLLPAFSPGLTSYSLAIPSNASSVGFLFDSSYTITLDESEVPSGTQKVLSLLGDHLCHIVVRSGNNLREYSVDISYTDAIHVSATGSDSLNFGYAPEDPLATVAAGLARAVESGVGQVRVSEGSYDQTATLALPGGVLLRGGFSTDFAEQDPGLYPTVLHDSRVNLGNGVSRTSVLFDGVSDSGLEGFVVEGVDCSDDTWLFGVWVTSDSLNIRVAGNTIRPGTTSVNVQTSGIYCESSSVTIEGNYVEGGSSGWAKALEAAADFTARNNVFYGGGGSHSAGVFSHQGPGDVSTHPLIYGNLILGGSGSAGSEGVHIAGNRTEAAKACPQLYNNTIFAGSGAIGFGVLVYNSSMPSLANNIIFADSASGYAVQLDSNAGGGSNSFGVFKNNELWNLGRAEIGFNKYLGQTFSSASDFNNSALLYASEASGNICLDLSSGVFVSLDGADGLAGTPADNDWRLGSLSAVELREGGLDLSTILPSLADADGNLRTTRADSAAANNGAAGWSMGAYEY